MNVKVSAPGSSGAASLPKIGAGETEHPLATRGHGVGQEAQRGRLSPVEATERDDRIGRALRRRKARATGPAVMPDMEDGKSRAGQAEGPYEAQVGPGAIARPEAHEMMKNDVHRAGRVRRARQKVRR